MPDALDWSERAAKAQSVPCNVPSPCLSVCTMQSVNGLCAGCWRTLDEIAAWASLQDDQKRIIWNHIARRSALQGEMP